MSPRSIAVCAAGLFFLSLAPVAADLTVVMHSTQVAEIPRQGTRQSETMVTQKVKGTRARVDIHHLDARAARAVGDSSDFADAAEGGTLVMLNHAKKTFRKLTPAAQEQSRDKLVQVLGPQALASRPQLRPTGKHDVIDGHPVDEYSFSSARRSLTYWFDKSLARYVPELARAQITGGAMGSVASLRFPDPASFPGIPIRIEIEESGFAGPGSRMRVDSRFVSLSDAPIGEEQFKIPADYTEMTLPGHR